MNFLKGSDPAEQRTGDLRLAVAVLLVEAAHRDEQFGPEERAVIERLLTEKFALSKDECDQLISSGEATTARMVQLHPYTHAVFEQMDPEERIQLIEMLWEVAYADGVLDPEEDALIRKIGGLIYITDRDRMLARKRVLERMGRQN
ncbi:MAG TPA: TerB family tellurite resistance protein [Rhizomicrobium sp.]|nr:TerB family tellurite resistance protein [Rhizomicrobium sp.]